MKENSPVKLARKLLLGTMLGDSCLRIRGKYKAHLVMTHSNKQFDYLMWKAKILVPLVGKFDIDERPLKLRDKDYGYRTQLRTLSSKYLKHIYNDFYFNREDKTRKEIHLNVLNRLTPISLAVLYGDDGNLSPYGAVRIATHSFRLKEIELFCKWLESQYGFRFSIKFHKQSSAYSIIADKNNSNNFIELVSPYLRKVKCLHHKLGLNKDSDSFNSSARLPGFWDDDILRSPWKQGEMVRNNHSLALSSS